VARGIAGRATDRLCLASSSKKYDEGLENRGSSVVKERPLWGRTSTGHRIVGGTSLHFGTTASAHCVVAIVIAMLWRRVGGK